MKKWLVYKTTFDAAHKIPGKTKCNQLHGHTYRLELCVLPGNMTHVYVGAAQGNVKVFDCQTPESMIMDFYDLRFAIDRMLEDYDHTYLNNNHTETTVEYIAEAIHTDLKKLDFEIRYMELFETDSCGVRIE